MFRKTLEDILRERLDARTNLTSIKTKYDELKKEHSAAFLSLRKNEFRKEASSRREVEELALMLEATMAALKCEGKKLEKRWVKLDRKIEQRYGVAERHSHNSLRSWS